MKLRWSMTKNTLIKTSSTYNTTDLYVLYYVVSLDLVRISMS